MCVCAATMFCYESTSRRHMSSARKASVATLSSRTRFVPTSTIERTGLRSTVPASADSRRDRCDRLTSTLISEKPVVAPTVVDVATEEDISEVCLRLSADLNSTFLQGSQLSWNSWYSWNFKVVLSVLKLSWNQKLSWNFSHLLRMSWYWALLCCSYGIAFILYLVTS